MGRLLRHILTHKSYKMRLEMTIKERNAQECDATGDAIEHNCRQPNLLMAQRGHDRRKQNQNRDLVL